jgi:pyrroloquinoline quinone biosynthesis protein B
VLGSAAGGPQWNCGCRGCQGVRDGTIPASPRTQESLAVSADGEAWIILNASPEIRQQIESFPSLRPRAPRDSPIVAIVLTSGDLDHCLGLLSLRESQPLTVWATDRVRRGFTEGNSLFRTLERFPEQVRWRMLEPGRTADLVGPADRPIGLTIEPVTVAGKPPIHLEGRWPADPGDNVGLRIHEPSTGRLLAYFPGVGALGPSLRVALDDADCIFLDGTFWSSNELIVAGLGTRRAEQMAHVPLGGPEGTLAQLADVRAGRRILIDVNNTNPLLIDESPERAMVRTAGWEVAYDGMEITL